MVGADDFRSERCLRSEKRQPRNAVTVGKHVEIGPRNVATDGLSDLCTQKRQRRVVRSGRKRPTGGVVSKPTIENDAFVAGEADILAGINSTLLSSRTVENDERLAHIDDRSMAIPIER